MFINFMNYCGVEDVAHKPALLVSVSSGRGGAFPINQMRQLGYKNNRIMYLPEHLIVRSVEKVMNQQLDLNLEQTPEVLNQQDLELLYL
jgi:NAD(P)H-dependent FMN reductase